ncbi:hypothetical protein [Roseococcus sp.]|uniref:hypothetical protein n=1 Tax=Roseococcus sp. TaxID=2109646 RepID=UPI003BA8B9FA
MPLKSLCDVQPDVENPFTLAQYEDDRDGGWLHPFEDNLLEIKLIITDEYIPYGEEEPWLEECHLNLCRQLAGGN